VSSVSGPRCFLHIPKSAGSSFHAVLHAGYPPEAISPRRCDTTEFTGFDAFDELPAQTRNIIAADEHELEQLAGFEIVSGHFTLPNLLRLTTPDHIATILREPRARLMSLYAYYRLSPWLVESWRPYDRVLSGRLPLDEFLADETLAAETDNQTCRLLLHGDARIPADGFIAPEAAGPLAAAACDALATLGLVEVLESGDRAWQEFGRFFGVDARPVEVNVTAERHAGVSDLPPLGRITPRTIALLEDRTTADAIVYQRILGEKGWAVEDARRLSDAAFSAQLARLGDLAGSRARAAEELSAAIARRDDDLQAVSARLRETEADLDRHRGWLAGVQSSASWQMTSPLRNAKRIVRRRRGGR
jgi:hypothetical protein